MPGLILDDKLLSALRVSKVFITAGAQEGDDTKAHHFMVKSVIRAMILVLEEHKSVQSCDSAVVLFANLFYMADVSEDALTKKDLETIIDLLELCNDSVTFEKVGLSKNI